MSSPKQGDISILLSRFFAGDRELEDTVLKLLYKDLRRLAAHYMRSERPDHTLQATALVHEAYLRISRERETRIQNRSHFFALASRAMRRVLVDHARATLTGKRMGFKLSLDEALVAAPEQSASLLALDDALERLSLREPRQARIVEMHFFSGLTLKEIADLLDISERTAKRDWSAARDWLHTQLSEEVIDGRYRVDRHLGGGRMTQVYEVFDNETQTPCALKLLSATESMDQAARRALLQELQRWRKIIHPHICSLQELGWHDGAGLQTLYYTMPLLRGETLEIRAARELLDETEALVIGEQIASGIDAAHRFGMNQCPVDVKNVFLTSVDGAVIMDAPLTRYRQTDRPAAGADFRTLIILLSRITKAPRSWSETLNITSEFKTAAQAIEHLRQPRSPLKALSRRLRGSS